MASPTLSHTNCEFGARSQGRKDATALEQRSNTERTPRNTHPLRASRQVKLPWAPIGGAGTALYVILYQGRALLVCPSICLSVCLSIRPFLSHRWTKTSYTPPQVNGFAPKPSCNTHTESGKPTSELTRRADRWGFRCWAMIATSVTLLPFR